MLNSPGFRASASLAVVTGVCETTSLGDLTRATIGLAAERSNVEAAYALPLIAATYGEAMAEQWFHRWRVFFMSCAELFGYEQGQQWWVSHYLFEPRP